MQTTKTTHYDWSLPNKDNSDRYMMTQRNKFNALQDISETLTQNDEYNFINAYIEAAAEYIPTKEPNRVPWETLLVEKTWKQHPNVIKGIKLMPMPET